MENKILIKLIIPEIGKEYDIFVPINRKVGNIIILFNKLFSDEINNIISINNFTELYDGDSGERLEIDTILKNTKIRNNSRLILLSNK
ncbi:MAG: hypothetical protein PUA90_05625 [bacterium]|nr:hypothetical protein [bacterium]